MFHHDGLSILTTEPLSTSGIFDIRDEAPVELVVVYAENSTEPPRVRYASGATRNLRLGWESSRASVRFGDSQNANPQDPWVAIISDMCYDHGHTSPQCQLPLRDVAHVVVENDALNLPDRKSVLAASYLRAWTDYSNLLARKLHSWPNPIDGLSGLARSYTNRPEVRNDQKASKQPVRAFVAEATDPGSDENSPQEH